MGLFPSVFRLPAICTKTVHFSPNLLIFSKSSETFPKIAVECVETIDTLIFSQKTSETGQFFSDILKWRLVALLFPLAPFYYRSGPTSKTEKHFGCFVLAKINVYPYTNDHILTTIKFKKFKILFCRNIITLNVGQYYL